MVAIDLASLPTIDAESCCPDPTRSSTGAWLLSGSLLPRVDDLKSQEPSLTSAQCFERLGAEWVDDYYSASNDEPLNFLFEDPVKTKRLRISDGTEYRGAWMMTMEQKGEADALRRANVKWEWSRCYEAVGGCWDGGYYRLELDNDGDGRASTRRL